MTLCEFSKLIVFIRLFTAFYSKNAVTNPMKTIDVEYSHKTLKFFVIVDSVAIVTTLMLSFQAIGKEMIMSIKNMAK